MASKERIQSMHRWPIALHKKIVRAAKANERSMNAEIIARLEESFQICIDRDRHAEILSRLDAIEGIVKGDFCGL